MMKSIVLCADDYGQATFISRAIVALLERGRLTATSCLVTAPDWEAQADWLRPFVGHADLGLHVNLTEGRAISPVFINTYGDSLFSLPVLMARAALRQLDYAAIEAECVAQLERFSGVMGCLPNYLDGHQHVHQFPVVRDAIIKVYEQYLRPQRAYIRWVSPKMYSFDYIRDFKKVVIYAMGARPLGQLLRDKRIPHNQTFAGIYGFKGPYPVQFRRFLMELGDGGILMCHPALENGSDAIADARLAEYQYFASTRFVDDCERFHVKISRFKLAL